jgi:hypothetical protein
MYGFGNPIYVWSLTKPHFVLQTSQQKNLSVKFVSRNTWQASPDSTFGPFIRFPPPIQIICHALGAQFAYDEQEECKQDVFCAVNVPRNTGLTGFKDQAIRQNVRLLGSNAENWYEINNPFTTQYRMLSYGIFPLSQHFFKHDIAFQKFNDMRSKQKPESDGST